MILAAFAAGALVGGAAVFAFLRRKEKEASELRGRLLAFALHEVNTPLTAVNMTIINLVSGVFGDVPPDQMKWVEMMRDQAGRLNSIVGEIRDLIHLDFLRDLAAFPETAEAPELVEEALSPLRRGFEHAGIELRVELPESLPRVRADRDRAVRTLSSLLYHARKFRMSGPVVLRASRDGSKLRFTIDYAGQKLSPDAVGASMDLFYPAHKRSDQLLAATGLGLGLPREVMRLAGGDVALAADAAGAARLTLTLPVEEAA